MSRTLSLQLPDALFEALERMARQKGTSAESLGATWLVAAIERVSQDPVMQLAGTLHSGTPDLAVRHDEYLGRTLEAEVNRRKT